MSHSRRTTPGFGVIGAVLLAGCATDSVTSPNSVTDEATAVSPAFSLVNGLACQTITFNEGGLTHGGIVTSIGLDGMTIGFSVVPNVPDVGFGPAPAGVLHAFDTNNQTHPEDRDLMVQPVGYCTDCLGLNNVLIIGHQDGFAAGGDYRWGGAITLSGFADGYYIKSFTVLDNESPADFPPPESTVKLFVGGEVVGESSMQGDGSVEVVNTTMIKAIPGSVMFLSGTVEQDAYGGSGALDDIVVCPMPNQGCTPGYWKNHEDAWASTGYDPDDTLGEVFDIPAKYASLANVELIDALSLKGGSTDLAAARLLLHHAVAALLNATSDGVAYPRTDAQIIAAVNAELATGSRSTMLALKNALDRDNNLGCPLN